MRVGVIVASHGEFARAALGSVEMVAGPQQDVRALALTADKSAETFEAEFAQAYAELKAECDLIVTICDIHGGTPFNVISRSILKGMDMVAFTGLSLPVLIELLLSRDQASDADEIRGLIEAAHAQTLAEIQVEMAQGSSDEDDLDL
ncbi:PTS sugar transporter subunit IIA [Thermophilibacter provencensis]|uniref:PTS sugar transporter subunit IIA n=1 Tax=Thermophilibacter provencensis TaxID=1852386 RepID=UPI00094B3C11|nr:PTS sugar transporter subunit IIA [Thermophilibacter provencensis]